MIDGKLETSEQVLVQWEKIKAGEKRPQGAPRPSLFKELPPRLPALMYAEAVWKPSASTRIIPGVRFDYEATLKYATVDPRLSVFQEIREGTVLKGAVGLYQQPPDFSFQEWTATFGNPNTPPSGIWRPSSASFWRRSARVSTLRWRARAP